MSFFSSKHGKGKPHSEHLCGGTIDNTDNKAPKVITSKQLTYFSACVYLSTRENQNGEHNFDFEIKQSESSTLTAYEHNLSVSCKADTRMLESLQTIIDKFSLALKNGENRITAGLPPEYQPCTFKALYASGEQLYFRYDNDPFAQWAEEVYTVFAEHFAQNGERSLVAQTEQSQVTHVRFVLHKDGKQYWYSGINVDDDKAINGQTYLLQRQVYDFAAKQTLSRRFILFPQDFYENITAILDRHSLAAKYDLSRYDRQHRDFGNHSRGYFGFGEKPEGDDPDIESESIALHVKYESGKTVTVSTAKRGEIDGMQPLVTDLLHYLDPLFE